MVNNELIKYGKYITALISSIILNTAPPAPFEGIDWVKLFELSEKHGVDVMIYSALKDIKLPEHARNLFETNKNFMLARFTRQTIEAERVTAALEANSVKYIKLKGAHIRDYYPASYMRSFGDVDLCLTKEGRKSVTPIMENLGYKLACVSDYHDEYERDEFHIFEMHSAVMPPNTKYAEVFDNPFSKAVAIDEKSLGYVFSNELLYLHLLFHLHKHFTQTGCGIRLFVDFLVYREKITDTDFEYIESILDKYSMSEFHKTLNKLLDYFFYEKEASDDLLKIAEYVFSNQPVGIYKYHVASLGFFGKIKYFLKNWFPSAKDLAFRYPVLEKAPVLLPVCWVRRIFYSLFFNRSAFKKQADNVKTALSREYKDIKEIRKTAEKSN